MNILGINPVATLVDAICDSVKTATSAGGLMKLPPTIGGILRMGAPGSVECLVKGLFEGLRSALKTTTKTEYCPAKSVDGYNPGYAKPGCSGSNPVRALLCDPSLSLEEKVQLTLSAAMDRVDADVERTLGEIANAQGDKGSLEKLHVQLQRLMERRKLMFDLMSNMSQKFTEMAKTAIQNLARA